MDWYYIKSIAFTKKVQEKGSTNQNHCGTKRTMAIIMAVEIKNNIQLRPDEDFSKFIVFQILGGKISNPKHF